MSTISHQPGTVSDKRPWSRAMLVEVGASVAIAMMWVAVAVSAVWGPDFVSTSPGGSSTTIPSAIAVALFAWLGSWAVAKAAFRRREGD